MSKPENWADRLARKIEREAAWKLYLKLKVRFEREG